METPKSLTGVGPITAIALLSIWSEGGMSFSVMELRHLIIIISDFLEEVEDIRGGRQPRAPKNN